MRAIGVIFVLTGLLWAGQGMGIVHWPESSFMVDQRPWAWRGGLLALAGVAIILFASRTRR